MRFLKRLFYKLKCRYWSKFTTVCPKTLPKDCWVDRDDLMLHCMFDILCQFVEEEMSPKEVEKARKENTEKFNRTRAAKGLVYSPHPYHESNMRIVELYDWWKKEYPYYSIAEGPYSSFQQEIKENLKVRKQLYKLVSVTPFLWS